MRGFVSGKWEKNIDVRDFIQKNYTPYLKDDSFLCKSTDKTSKLWSKCLKLLKKELEHGVLDIDVNSISGVNEFEAGYIDRSLETIYGLQSDAPLKRIVNIYGGKRMAETSLEMYGYALNPELKKPLYKYLKTHNEGVFDAYTDDMKLARKAGLLTGLPDAYGRGRIIGDYRRIALYGIDYLIQHKQKDLSKINGIMNYETIELREKVNEQIKSLNDMKKMALKYGFDISLPAKNAKEAVQWLYFGYLSAVKENNGAAMSLGRTASFLDIYIERDLKNKLINESTAQELIDQFVIKLRLVRHLRTKAYDELFAGDPTWVTEALGGMGEDGRTLVTKTTYRFLNTLINLGSAPEPNLTILWSNNLPEPFKKYCSKLSIITDALQYENDDIMRPIYGDDYGIACCVSAMRIGKQMQYFGARCNIAKALLYAINGGIDEILELKVISGFKIIKDEILDYEKILKSYDKMLKSLAKLYSDTMNVIHHMHDKYAYEKSQMALHDTNIERLMAFGIAGLSVAVDSLSAIKYAKVKPIRNSAGIAIDFEIVGDYPKYGNDDDRVDDIAVLITDRFYKYLSQNKLINNSFHTLSVLTITSNVVYGKKTGSTPDGRKLGEPFAPGANPLHGRDAMGALASLNSVSKIKYSESCRDGISNTFSIVPEALGSNKEDRINNLVGILDGYFNKNGHHLNVNVLNKKTLIDAMKNPDKYPTLTIRVSGYAVNFNRLSKAHQLEVINRTFHEA